MMDPFCAFSGCAAPLRIPNGNQHLIQRTSDLTFAPNTTVTYTCRTGYQLVGKAEVSCKPVPGSSPQAYNWTALPECKLREQTLTVRNYRDYFLRAEKITWDYLPLNSSTSGFGDEHIKKTLETKANRIGSKYSKFVFRLYTDGNYTQEIKSPASQGYVGPLLRGEVGEVIRVRFRNDIHIPVSVHPHGVRYTKVNEGALYADGTNATSKVDDGVSPGSEYTYVWELTSDFAPRDDDPSCMPFAYHSHVDPDKEINSGLVGLLVVCKQGMLSAAGSRNDVDSEHVLYFDSILEGNSWLVAENLKRCVDPDECKRLYESGDEKFKMSLMKDSINGYMFGNLPNLTVCAGERVAWYIFSLSAELHTFNIDGQTFISNKHRSSTIGIWPGTFREAVMVADSPGTWLVQCINYEHWHNGMEVLLTVKDCGKVSPQQLSGRVRRYFLSAEVEDWNYAPTGRNVYMDQELTIPNTESEKYFAKTYNGKPMIGGTYRKSRFNEYTSTAFNTHASKSTHERHLGLLGPVIRAEVGDTVNVTLRNLTPYPVSIAFQGVSVSMSMNGFYRRVNSGGLGFYTFTVPWGVGPGDDDPPCLTYIYYSDVNMERDVNSGLVGPMLICKPGALDVNTGKQRFIDREMFLYFASIDENLSWYIDHNVATYVNGSVDRNGADFVASNVMSAINGFSYGNLEGLSLCRYENVVWHVLSFGSTESLHVVTFNGNNVVIDGRSRDSHVIISGQAFNAFMKPDNDGTWSLHCHNSVEYNAGMTALYHVEACGSPNPPPFLERTGRTRRYFIAAVERKWNYCPNTSHPLDGMDIADPGHNMHILVQKDGQFVGSIYTKAFYREFTDETFASEKQRTADEVHLGIQGPMIKAEVGDVVEVVFKNMASRPYSIHAQGLRYNSSYEGMAYADGQPVTSGDGVTPGATFTYRWEVPFTAAPSGNGPNCVNFLYYSAVNLDKDIFSGLAGTIVVCRKGILNDDGSRSDSIEKEFSLLFVGYYETHSWYLSQNIQENCPGADTTTKEFLKSNIYASVNGYIFNNVKGLTMQSGDNVAWYISALGKEGDTHTVHFHGQTYIYRTDQTHEGDVIEVFPGTYETVEMYASNPGTWLIHCHVGLHMVDGMIATYTVE
ncbi:ferroxidase HEPHL1-like [Mya arenaria]|uniref:ferroxidase HEPHL1-like n=1 Tax=Mya arenaria TaxID=6604 RepID=UPI0022DEE68A|nr:ferroxidase HEPHL1-like [Mya arenaria]